MQKAAMDTDPWARPSDEEDDASGDSAVPLWHTDILTAFYAPETFRERDKKLNVETGKQASKREGTGRC